MNNLASFNSVQNHTTLKQAYRVVGSRTSFNSVQNHTTLKQLDSYSLLIRVLIQFKITQP